MLDLADMRAHSSMHNIDVAGCEITEIEIETDGHARVELGLQI